MGIWEKNQRSGRLILETSSLLETESVYLSKTGSQGYIKRIGITHSFVWCYHYSSLMALMKLKEESEKAAIKLNTQKTKIMASSPITSWKIDGETTETVRNFIFLGFKITVDGNCSHEIKRCLFLGRKVMTNLNSEWKSRDITLPTKVHIVKATFVPVVTYGCESWTIKEAECRRIGAFKLVLEKTLESPLDCKEIKPVNPKGNQLWLFIGRADAEAESPILWPPDVKSQLTGKDPNARKDRRQEEKGMSEDKVVGWHHWLNGHEFGQTPRDGKGQRSLACCSPWGHKESDMTERLNNEMAFEHCCGKSSGNRETKTWLLFSPLGKLVTLKIFLNMSESGSSCEIELTMPILSSEV